MGPDMSNVEAASVAAISVAVVTLLALTQSNDALCYLLAFPIWIVSRDLGVLPGMVIGVLALSYVVVVGTLQTDAFGPFGYLVLAAVFAGVVAAGGQAKHPNSDRRSRRPSAALSVLTTPPEIARGPDVLSPRELEVLEMIATGAKNLEIATRFVISLNTVKSHVGQILRKLPAKNRTVAAFRYVELYGAPHSLNGGVQQTDQSGAASKADAKVTAFLRQDRVRLRVQDSHDVEVPLIDQMHDCVEVGSAAIVYFDQLGRPVAWYLPDEALGVDVRYWEP